MLRFGKLLCVFETFWGVYTRFWSVLGALRAHFGLTSGAFRVSVSFHVFGSGSGAFLEAFRHVSGAFERISDAF